MRRTSQAGYSLFVNLSFFALFAGALCLCGYWISLYQHRKGIEEVVETVSGFFSSYQDVAEKMVQKEVSFDHPSYLMTYGLLGSCDEKESFFDKSRKVCKTALGELDIKIDYVYPFSYTYVYAHFMDMYKRHSCEQFLSAEWEKVIPKSWWDSQGYIGVVSEKTSGKIYFSYNKEYIARDGAQAEPTKQQRKQICKVCRNSRYCSVLIFFTLNENIFKNSENAIAIPN